MPVEYSIRFEAGGVTITQSLGAGRPQAQTVSKSQSTGRGQLGAELSGAVFVRGGESRDHEQHRRTAVGPPLRFR